MRGQAGWSDLFGGGSISAGNKLPYSYLCDVGKRGGETFREVRK